MARPRRRKRKDPVNQKEAELMASLVGWRRFKKPATCMKCGEKTWRRLTDNTGICQQCETDGSPS
jgi:hypothetical protein